MTESFVPLMPNALAADSAEPFRLKLLTGAHGAAIPLLPKSATVAGAHHGHAAEPQITLIRNGERITSIRVQCGCGEVTELECEY